jgi:3'-phosphoadenosine 5'-phosphosulfate sulfotransferase (PAPS reductase)/FAD synthetase
MSKEKLVISFSGGRTSAMMTKYLLDNYKDRYEMIVLFANTGKEREETLQFVNKCDKEFNFNVVWLEAVVNDAYRVGTKHLVTNVKYASRNGEPFEDLISKYGIPNQANPHCTRELKLAPINSYLASIGWTEYYTAIGIRTDEPKRLNWVKSKENKIIYFAQLCKVTKSDVNKFWSQQKFDLELKSYEGNCDLCWKKSDRKLITILLENPSLINWWNEMEVKYSNFTKNERIAKAMPPYYFLRHNRGYSELLLDSNFEFKKAIDESKTIDQYKQAVLWDNSLDSNYGCVESCELY